MRAFLLLLLILIVATFLFDWYTGGATWSFLLLLLTFFFWAALEWVGNEAKLRRDLRRYAIGQIRQAEAQCRTEELL